MSVKHWKTFQFIDYFIFTCRLYRINILYFHTSSHIVNRIGGVMVSMLVSNAVDRVFEPKVRLNRRL